MARKRKDAFETRIAFAKLDAWMCDVEPLLTVNESDDSKLAVIVLPFAARGDFFGGVPVLHDFVICKAK